jgi:hypothetical protein
MNFLDKKDISGISIEKICDKFNNNKMHHLLNPIDGSNMLLQNAHMTVPPRRPISEISILL